MERGRPCASRNLPQNKFKGLRPMKEVYRTSRVVGEEFAPWGKKGRPGKPERKDPDHPYEWSNSPTLTFGRRPFGNRKRLGRNRKFPVWYST